jgi:enoyl-CoA hydratase/carnithine racemase
MTNEPPVVLQRRQVLPQSGKEVVVVSINRPDRLNCFNADVCEGLASIFASLKDETDLAAVIFTGEGSSFCAGADLSDPPSPLVQSSDLPDHLQVNPVHQMSLLKVPLIGALRGYVSAQLLIDSVPILFLLT